MAIERVAVLGGGLMGSGIAEVSAAAGLSVAVREIDERALEAAQGRIESSLARAVRLGRSTGVTSPGMLVVARELSPPDWRTGTLFPFESGEFDAVICGLSVTDFAA